MISLETARKLKEAGLQWEPQMGDFLYYFTVLGTTVTWRISVISEDDNEDSNIVIYIDDGDWIFAPRLDQLLAEIEKRGWKWSIVPSRNRYCLIFTTVKQFVADSPDEAAALALLWILEQEGQADEL